MLILDDESPFLELMPFAGYKHSTPSGSLIVGIGLVQYAPLLVLINLGGVGH